MGDVLAAGGDAKIVQLWDLREESLARHSAESPLQPVVKFKTMSVIYSLALTASGTMLAVGTGEQTELYTVHKKKGPSLWCEPLLCLDYAAQTGGIAFSQEQSRLVIGGNQLVTVFDCKSGGTISSQDREGRVRCVAISDNGQASGCTPVRE